MILIILVITLGVFIYSLAFGDVFGIKELRTDLKNYINEIRNLPAKEMGESEKTTVDRLQKTASKNKDINYNRMDLNFRISSGMTPPVTSGKDYIPVNLSERDKVILRMFNEK